MSWPTSHTNPSTSILGTARHSEAANFDHVIAIFGLEPNSYILRALETEGIYEVKHLLCLDNISLTNLQCLLGNVFVDPKI